MACLPAAAAASAEAPTVAEPSAEAQPEADASEAAPSKEETSAKAPNASSFGYPGPLLKFGEYRFPDGSTAQVLNHSLQLIELPSGGTEFIDLITFKYSLDPKHTKFETAYMAYEVSGPHPLVPTELKAVKTKPDEYDPSVFHADFPAFSKMPVPIRLHRD